jgi:integrase/recombinase XerD
MDFRVNGCILIASISGATRLSLKFTPNDGPEAFAPRIEYVRRAYCEWAREERGLSEETIAVTYGYVKAFLCWYGSHRRSISAVRISDIDDYLTYGGKVRGWSRHFVYDVAKGLKAFFRYGGEHGWASDRLATCIRGPRLYAFERLPQCPSWPDVQRLLKRLDPKQPNDARDRAILMLLAFYGLRSSEVAKLRLEDVDWEHDLLRVSRAKRHPRQTYPLLPSVGNAILQYLRFVRPLSNERALFLTLTFPHRELSRGSIYQLVSKHLVALPINIPHRGPHCLRHACATHLLTQGLSMKEIGDHLGHRRSLSTRVYAKVDMLGLRRVAAFDMGALP